MKCELCEQHSKITDLFDVEYIEGKTMVCFHLINFDQKGICHWRYLSNISGTISKCHCDILV